MVISATQFKARCLKLLDEVAAGGAPLVITKHGRPVARLVAIETPDSLRGSVKYNLTDDELVYMTVGPWTMDEE